MIETRDITYDVGNETMVGYLAKPEGTGSWPVVLLGHDGVGLDDYQRGRADDLAEHGYLTFAMDYHGGRTFFGEPEAMLNRVMPMMADTDRMLSIGRTALDVLLAEPGADPGQIAAVGYGAGARIVLELARAGAGFKAVAVIHPGLPLTQSEEWADADATYLLCTGSDDPLCTPTQLLDLGNTMQNAGIDWRANIYGGAQHAFWARPKQSTGPGDAPAERTVPGVGYHATHAQRAWQAVLDLVRGGDGAQLA
ncbi:dienelactone hydrolase family protein [Arthrobacter sp. ISL-48]|uniref:dienelactone hydrolase family protein n=1 Tax=Arthrobacter sp. ISL-48 TaxID=2819110 RepID=UPI001BE52136|nr:dienelactone hydrolase family protein [Arthrobacter sp. ISL-48]MBT2533986.1 dienelactone hydrolase family protein [Arthrobacter sp. ISL-48]